MLNFSRRKQAHPQPLSLTFLEAISLDFLEALPFVLSGWPVAYKQNQSWFLEPIQLCSYVCAKALVNGSVCCFPFLTAMPNLELFPQPHTSPAPLAVDAKAFLCCLFLCLHQSQHMPGVPETAPQPCPGCHRPVGYTRLWVYRKRGPWSLQTLIVLMIQTQEIRPLAWQILCPDFFPLFNSPSKVFRFSWTEMSMRWTSW